MSCASRSASSVTVFEHHAWPLVQDNRIGRRGMQPLIPKENQGETQGTAERIQDPCFRYEVRIHHQRDADDERFPLRRSLTIEEHAETDGTENNEAEQSGGGW